MKVKNLLEFPFPLMDWEEVEINVAASKIKLPVGGPAYFKSRAQAHYSSYKKPRILQFSIFFSAIWTLARTCELV